MVASGKSRTIQFDFKTACLHGLILAPLYYCPQFSTDRWDRVELDGFKRSVVRVK
jgi:hypothetical protein